MNCEKCSEIIHEGDTSCVGMEEEQWNALFNNAIWMCDCCMSDFCKYRDRWESAHVPDDTTRSVSEEIMDLKAKVATICETLAAITASKPHSSEENTQLHSTPVSSPCFRGGARPACVYSEVDGCEADEQRSRNNDDNNFDLFLTNISPNVTEHEISLTVSRCLGNNSADDLDVKKLVSKQTDSSKLDCII